MRHILAALILLVLSVGTAGATPKFAVCSTACTWDGSSTAMWSLSSGGATGAAVPVAADTVTLDANTCVGGTTCTITVNTNFNIASLAMGACTASTTGCILDFSVNNNSVTVSTNGFSITGSGVRQLKMGSAVINITGSNGFWDATTVTNLTLTPGTSNIVFSGASTATRTFTGGGKTYATVTVSPNSSSGVFQFTDTGNTFGTLAITAPNWIFFSIFTTQTVTNQITWSGTSTQQLLVSSNSQSLSGTINSPANAAMTWAAFYRITMGGGGTHAATNSFNNGNNSGFTISAPSSIGGGGGGCILGGWLLWRDLPEHINDNFPAWIDEAA